MNEQSPSAKKSMGPSAGQTPIRRQMPIAVVGVAALYPGSIQVDGFWRNIFAGRDLITDVPPGHWRIEDYYDADPKKRGKTYGRRGGFLPKVPFTPMDYGIPPTSLPATDTAQLLSLVVARQVLEDALGSDFASISLERASIILGVTSATELVASMASSLQRPVWMRALREAGIAEPEIATICDRIETSYSDWTEATFPGLLGNVVAGRVANRFNFGGTNCVVDAACASSLAAVRMAIQELESGATDLAITGGVDAINDVFMFMCFSKTPALSASGDCRPFSADADGTLLGEGLGMLALRRLDDAERDGNQIYAVLRGLGGSSDGRAKSVYAPLAEGQARALRRAYESAGYNPSTVEMVEAHGTGTVAGDATELAALQQVFGEARSPDRAADQPWCAIGSVKSQIGHTKSAAGAASLYKAVMALHHKVLPPTIKLGKPTAALEAVDTPFYANTAARPWIRAADHPRRASVSSFGFGGSNFHITVEEYTGQGTRPPRARLPMAELFLFSGIDADAVLSAAQMVVAGADGEDLEWLARQSQAEFRVNEPARLALVAQSFDELSRRLEQAAKLNTSKAASASGVYWGRGASRAGKVAFLFPGQGSPYLGMGDDLAMAFPRSRAIWDRVASRADSKDLHRIVFPPPRDGAAKAAQAAALMDTRNAQPALAATSALYLDLLRAAGIEGDMAAGHSFGELVALHWSGALDGSGLLALAQARGAAMGQAAATVPGGMTAVRGAAEDVAPILKAVGDGLVLANLNATRQVVLAGSMADLDRAEALLVDRGLGFKRLAVPTAFHSPMMRPAMAAFRTTLTGATIVAPRKPVVSNVTAAAYEADAASVRRGLADQLASPVRFAESVETLYAAGARIFIEVGPGSVLTGLVDQCLDGRDHLAVAMDGRGGTVMARFLDGLAALAAAGVPLDLAFAWDGYRDKPPRELRAVPGSVMIDGTNYGKPFPPVENAPANIARPATLSSPPISVNSVSQDRVMPPVELPPSAMPTAAAPAPQPPTSATSAVQAEVLAAFERIHAQAAEAHRATQQAMAEAHLAYLRTTEATLVRLQGMLGGSPTVAVTAAAPAPVWTAPAPAPIAVPIPAPASIRPVAQPAPLPVPLPPVIVRAPEPAAAIAQPLPAQIPPAAPIPAQNAMATLIAVVADKTGYPANMLTLDMELEADLGIDSIKRVEILSELQKRFPAFAELDTRELSILPTLRAIVEHVESGTSGATQKKTSVTADLSPNR
jgi:polyketide-type polyunsaturated fatty acid synthase PfaA